MLQSSLDHFPAWLVRPLANAWASCEMFFMPSISVGLLPDVLVKGGDYKLEEIHGRDEVEAAGGAVVALPFVEGASTTAMIEKVKRKP